MSMCEYWSSNDWYLYIRKWRKDQTIKTFYDVIFSILIAEQSIVKMNRILWLNDNEAKIFLFFSDVDTDILYIYSERQRSIFHLFSTLLSSQYLKSQLNCRFRFIHSYRCTILHLSTLSIVNEANVKVINLMRLRSIGKRRGKKRERAKLIL